MHGTLQLKERAREREGERERSSGHQKNVISLARLLSHHLLPYKEVLCLLPIFSGNIRRICWQNRTWGVGGGGFEGREGGGSGCAGRKPGMAIHAANVHLVAL